MVTILDSVKCGDLDIHVDDQNLNSEETRALVRALETRVQELYLFYSTSLEMGLLIKTLVDYSGDGMCQIISCSGNIPDKYREELRSWAVNKYGWRVSRDDADYFEFKGLDSLLL